MTWEVKCYNCDDGGVECCDGTNTVKIIKGLCFTNTLDPTDVVYIHSPINAYFQNQTGVFSDSQGNSLTVPFTDTGFATMADFIKFVKDCKCPVGEGGGSGEIDSVIVTCTDGELVVTVNGVSSEPKPIGTICQEITGFTAPPTPAEVTAWAATNTVTDGIVFYVGNGTADDPDYVFYVDVNGVAKTLKSPSSGGECVVVEMTNITTPNIPTQADALAFAQTNGITDGYLWYGGTEEEPQYVFSACGDKVICIKSPSTGNCYKYQVGDAIVKATCPNVSVTKTTGRYDIVIPSGCEIKSIRFFGEGGDLDSNFNMDFCFDYSATGMTMSNDFLCPSSWSKWNEASRVVGGAEAGIPFPLDQDSDPQIQVASISATEVCYRAINLNGLPFWGIDAIFG